MAKSPLIKILQALVFGLTILSAPIATAQTTPAAQIQTARAYGTHMGRAIAAIQNNNWPAALTSAKAAFSAAQTDNERLNAARLAANAHFRAGQFSRAEWWLRKAMNNAVEGPGAQAIRQDFARVRQANPLSVQLSFSAAPNNNVNNGSSSDTITIWNLPFILSPDAQALSGYEVSGSVNLQYRLAQSADFATDIGLLLHGRTYWLSPAAAAAAPTVQGSDYAFSVVELQLTHTRNITGFPGPSSITLHLGKNWYGGDPYTQYSRLILGQKLKLGDATGLNLTAGYENQLSETSGATSEIYSLSAVVNHSLANRDGLGLNIRLQDTQSQDPGSENLSLKLGLSYGFAKPVAGMQFSLNMAAEQRRYDFSIYDASGRQDLTLSAGATVVFVEKSYFGFSPTMGLEANRTTSNIALFNRETVALRLGLKSVF